MTNLATSWNQYARGLANGKIVLYHPKTYDEKINEFLYSFNRDEWTKSFLEISDDVKGVMLECEPFVHILCVKNVQNEKWVYYSNKRKCLCRQVFKTNYSKDKSSKDKVFQEKSIYGVEPKTSSWT